jgi:hypothetical protein
MAFFWTHSGLLYDRVRLDERFPMGPRSVSGDENSLRYDLGEWVLASSKAVNVACLAIFDPSTNSALSRQPKCVKQSHIRLYDPVCLSVLISHCRRRCRHRLH